MLSNDVGRLPKDFLTLGDIGDKWITAHCRVPQGFARGKPYRMADWQFWCHAHRYQIKPNAEFVPPDEVGPDAQALLAQAFMYQQTMVVGPQKTGKGPNSATSVAFEAVGPSVFAGFAQGGEVYYCADNGCPCGFSYRYREGQPMGMRHPSPLIQITATSEDQADNIYGPLRAMVRLGPLKHTLAVREGFMRVLSDSGDDDLDRIDVVTASANARLGNPISDAEQDEVGLYLHSNKLIGVADAQARGAAAMGGRTHLTTNCWNPSENSLAQIVYEADESDVWIFYRNPDLVPDLLDDKGKPLPFEDDECRRKILEFVYEGSWWADLDSIDGLARKLMKRDPAQAERFFGNRLVRGAGAWLPPGLWASAWAGDDALVA